MMCKWIDRVFVYFTFISLILCIFPLSSMSQEINLWKNLGIYGGTIYDIAIDPRDPNRMFAGSFMGDGVFLTEDGGNSWQSVEVSNRSFREDTFKNHAVYAVKIAPGNCEVVWVAHDFWVEKSIDGGQTWIHISNSEMQSYCTNCEGEVDALRICSSLVIDPIDPNIVYVGTSGPNLANSQGAIFKTGDGGLTWKKIGSDNNEFDYEVVDIDIDPQDNNIIWAVTNSGGDEVVEGTLYRSNDNGDSWGKIFTKDDYKSPFTFFAVDVKPNTPNTVFTGSSIGIIKHYLREDRWQSELVEISEDCLVRDITFSPENPEVIYATWKDANNSLLKVAWSSNGGENWNMENVYEVEYEFSTLAVHPSNASTIFGGESNLGVFKSQDHGQTWEPINNGINAMIVNDIVIDPNNSTHILAGTHCGIYEKMQNGDWSRLTQEETRTIVFHPTNSQIFYVGIKGRLGKTTDGGDNWIYSAELSNSEDGYVSSIAIDPADPNILFIAIAGNGIYGRIYKSIKQDLDNGDWFGDPVLTSNYNFNAVAIDPSDSNHIFAGGGCYYDTNIVLGNLFESEEGGDADTWSSDPNKLTDVIVNTILIDPEDPNKIYVGCSETIDKKITVYRSIDGGEKWESSCKGMSRESLPIYGYNVWGTSSRDIFLVGQEGIILHYNGDTWSIMQSNTKRWLGGIWGTSSTDIFVTGEEGTMLHYNGNVWSVMDDNITSNLWNVWGISSNDVFAVGSSGTILHYNGNTWSTMESNTERWLGGIWGIDSTNIIVIGEEGTIMRYNGNTWSNMDSNTTVNLWGVWGASSRNAFAVGSNGTILHYDGIAWSNMDSNTTVNLWGVWGASSNDIFVVGSNGTILHYDGIAWSGMDSNTTENLMRVWGISSTEVFAAGNKGTIIQYNGNTWTNMNIGRKREPIDDDLGFSESDTSMSQDLRSSSHSHDKCRSTGEFGRVTRSSVSDFAFHSEKKNVIYATTMTNGVYISPDQGDNWLNLGILPYYVYSIATVNPVYLGTSNGAEENGCADFARFEGLIQYDLNNGIPGAQVRLKTQFPGGILFEIEEDTDKSGSFMFDLLTGYYDLTVRSEGYIDKIVEDKELCSDTNENICLQGQSIQQRIEDPNAGNIITVYPGTYYENIKFNGINGREITLTSIDPDDLNIVATTIIDGNQLGSVVTFENGGESDYVISGITLRNGYNTNGGGIYCNSTSLLISNCIIKENYAENYGGGIYVENSIPRILNTKMLNNTAGEQLKPNQICLMKANSIISCDIQTMIKCGITGNECAQRYYYKAGRWEALYYKFFGRPCGQYDPVQCDNCIFISSFP